LFINTLIVTIFGAFLMQQKKTECIDSCRNQSAFSTFI